MSRSDAYDRLCDYLEWLVKSDRGVYERRGMYGVNALIMGPGVIDGEARIMALVKDWQGHEHEFCFPLRADEQPV